MLNSGAFLPVLYLQSPFNPLIAAALMLSLLIIILYYLFSKLISSAQLEAFAREEFSQLIFTGLIFASFVFFSIFLSSLASTIVCGGSSCSHIDLALYSLGVVEKALASTYVRLYGYEFTIGLLSTVGFNIPLPVMPITMVWVSVSPFSGLEPVSNALVTIIESIGYLFGLAYGREMLVYFFRDITPTVLLPLGFVMRAMPFSRKTGSSIIAIAFAGYFAYPLSILLSHYMIIESGAANAMEVVNAPPAAALCEPPGTPGTPEYENYVNNSNQMIADNWETQLNDLTGRGSGGSSVSGLMAGGLSTAYSGFSDFFGSFFGAVTQRYNFNLLSPNMSPFIHFAYFFVMSKIVTLVQFIIMVLVTFVFEIIITVTAFRSLSHVLGGEIEILGLTKVV
ncbi:MAG: hypothetical protein NTY83_00085 [Candidatus Micrarchaeota archaeon]|nr:hypothetical protein [Candidatus Micrarchaeota archaeon]